MTTAHHSAGVAVKFKLQLKGTYKDRTSAHIAQRSIPFQINCGDRTSDSSRRRSQSVGGAASDSVMHTKGPRSIKIRHYCTTLHHHSTPRHCLSRRTNSLPPYTFTHAVYAQVGIVIFLRFRSLSNIPQYGSTPPNSCFQGSSNASKLTGSADRSEWRIVGIETHKKYSVPFAFAWQTNVSRKAARQPHVTAPARLLVLTLKIRYTCFTIWTTDTRIRVGSGSRLCRPPSLGDI
jgi:hypothetical protein